MQNNKLLLPVFVLILLTTFHCKKDPVVEPEPDPVEEPPVITDYKVKYFETYNVEYACDIAQVNDSETLILGWETLTGVSSWNSNSILIKIDENKEMVWWKSYGISEIENPVQLLPTNDGHFIILADRRFAKERTHIVKVDQEGNVIWDKIHFGRPDHITNTADGGYAIVDLNGYFGPDAEMEMYYANVDARIMKLDANGDLEWVKSTDQFDLINGRATIFQNADGGFTMIGTRSVNLGAGPDLGITMIKTDENGNLKLTKTIPIDGYEAALFSIEAIDGGFIVMGQMISYPDRKLILVKLDEEGEIVWQKWKGKSFNGTDITADAEQYYFTNNYDGKLLILNMGLDGTIGEIALDQEVPGSVNKIIPLDNGRIGIIGRVYKDNTVEKETYYLEIEKQD